MRGLPYLYPCFGQLAAHVAAVTAASAAHAETQSRELAAFDAKLRFECGLKDALQFRLDQAVGELSGLQTEAKAIGIEFTRLQAELAEAQAGGAADRAAHEALAVRRGATPSRSYNRSYVKFLAEIYI